MIVLDASAATQIALSSPEGMACLSLMLEGEKAIAPDFLRLEVRSAFWKYVRADILTREEAQKRISKAENLVDEYFSFYENMDEAFNEAIRNNHPIYDMLYLTLARRYSATLVSLDTRLLALCEEMDIDCIHKIDF